MVEGVSQAGSNNDKAKYANHRFEGKLVYHGLENWKHDPNNDKSYLVTIRSGGKDHEIWAVGLKMLLRLVEHKLVILFQSGRV